MLPVKA